MRGSEACITNDWYGLCTDRTRMARPRSMLGLYCVDLFPLERGGLLYVDPQDRLSWSHECRTKTSCPSSGVGCFYPPTSHHNPT